MQNSRGSVLVSVVIPVYNEEESVAELHRELVEVFERMGIPHEIIFVDDGSTDRTLERLQHIEGVGVISFAHNLGKSKALETGFQMARGKYIVTLDGDLQDDPNEIPQFIEMLEAGSDLVCGWKVARKDSLEKRFVSKIANNAARYIARSPVHDMNCGFKGYRAEVAKSLRFYADMHRYIPLTVSAMGYRVSEIPVAHRARKYGKSKYGLGRLLTGFFDILTLLFMRKFIDRPLHFFGIGGILSGALGTLILLYLSWLRLGLDETVGNRPLFFLGILLVVVGVQLFSLGFLGELVIRQSPTAPAPLRYKRLN